MADEVRVTGRWLDQISGEAKKTFGGLRSEFSLTSLAQQALATAGGISLVGAFQKITQAVADSTRAAVEQERADYSLMNSLKAVGQMSQEVYGRLKDQASQLQLVTRFSDDQVQAAQALAVNLGIGVGKIEEYTDAAATLAIMLNRDLSSAMRVLARADLGSEDQLKRLLGPFQSMEEVLDRLKAKQLDVVENSMGPMERAQHRFRVELDESRERMGAEIAFWGTLGSRIQVASSHLAEYLVFATKLAGGALNTNIQIGANTPSGVAIQSGATAVWDRYHQPQTSTAYPGMMTPWTGISGQNQVAMGQTFNAFIGPAGMSAGTPRPEVQELSDAFKEFLRDFRSVMGYALGGGYTSEDQVPVGVLGQYQQRKEFNALLQQNDPYAGMDELPRVIQDVGEATMLTNAALNDMVEENQRAADSLERARDYQRAFADDVVSSFQYMATQAGFTVQNMAETILGLLRNMVLRAASESVWDYAMKAGSYIYGAGGGGDGGVPAGSTDMGDALGSPAYERRRGRADY